MIKELQDETMEENSIEKITFVENEIKNTRRLFEEVGCHTFFDEDLCKAIEHIISDYKRTLKENEELKEEKEQAWEEWNNLEQGSYETEQKLKQQIKESQRENEELKERIREHTLLISPYYVKENYIPIQKVKDKIEELNKQLEEDLQDEIKVNSNRFIIICQCKSCLQELLGSEE